MHAAEIRRQALQKLAQASSHTVVSGDTLSGIAKRYGSTVKDLQGYNNIVDPNKIKPGQIIQLSAHNANPAKGSKPSTSGINPVAAELRKQFNNPNLEAAILANIDRETGGTFNHGTWQNNKKQTFDPYKKQTGGYGLFQFTGSSLSDYKKWLLNKKLTDSMENQIGFMKSDYGPTRSGWKKNTSSDSGLTREQLADWWHRRVETPAHTLSGTKHYNPTLIQKATQRHNDFMNKKIRSGKSGWTQV